MDCGNLTTLANGQVSHTTGTSLGQAATYSCNTGYNLVGDSTRTCEAAGLWSGSAPTCQGMLLTLVLLLADTGELTVNFNILYHVQVNQRVDRLSMYRLARTRNMCNT